LCDKALPLVTSSARWLGVELATVDITTDLALEADYHLRIPVVLDRRGRVLAEGQISRRAALLAALRGWI
jgi:hypothetical protein